MSTAGARGAVRSLLAGLVCAAALAGCDGKVKTASTANPNAPPNGPIQLQALFAGALFGNGAPGVGAIAPKDGETNVPLTTPIVAIFSESVDAKSVTSASFQVMLIGSTGFGGFGAPPGPVTGTVAVDPSTANRVAVFLPSMPLSPASRYAIRLTTGIVDLEGKALSIPGGSGAGVGSSFQEFRFDTVQTQAQPFRLMAMFPPPGDTNVPTTAKILLYFSEPVAMTGPGGVKTPGNVVVSAFGSILDGAIASAADPRVVTFTPTKAFKSGAQVTVKISNNVTNPMSVPLIDDQPIEQSFKVSSVPVPTQVTFPGISPITVASIPYDGVLTLDNIDEVHTQVLLSGGSASADSVTLLFFQSQGAATSAGRAFTKSAGAGGAKFKNDLGGGSSAGAFNDSNATPPQPILVGAYATSNGVNSPVGPVTLGTLFKKTTEPTVVFGPPTDDNDPFQFRTDLRLPAVFGTSSETLTAIKVFVDVGTTPSTLDGIALAGALGITDADGRFVTRTYDGPASSGAVRFLTTDIGEIRITDAVGNVFKKKAPKAGAIHQEGSIGGPLETGSFEALRVRVVREHDLAPLKAATVRVQGYPYDPLVPSLMRKTTGSGEVKFTPADLAPFGPRLLITAERDEFDVFTIAGCRNPGLVGAPFGVSLPLGRTGRARPELTVKTKGDIPGALIGSFAASSAHGGRAESQDFLSDARFASDAPLAVTGTTTKLTVPENRPFIPAAFEADGLGTFVFQSGVLRAIDADDSVTFDYAGPGGAMTFSDRFANTIVPKADVVTTGITGDPLDVTRARLIARIPGLPDVMPLSFFRAGDRGVATSLLLFAPVPPTLDDNEVAGGGSVGDPLYELLLQPDAALGTDPPANALLEAACRLEVEAADSSGKVSRFRSLLDFGLGGSVPTTEAIQLPLAPLVQASLTRTSHPPVLELFTDLTPANAIYKVTLRPQGKSRTWTVLVSPAELEMLPAPTLHLPVVKAKAFAVPGDYEATLEAYEFPAGTIDFNLFMFSDLERSHRRYARSATAVVTTTP